MPGDQPYIPAEYLISGSVFTSEQLVTQFEDFRRNLQHASTAPELVFERLAANLNNSFNNALESERRKYVGVLDGLEKELAELKLTGVTTNRELIQTPGGEGHPGNPGEVPGTEMRGTSPTVATTRPERPSPTIGVFHTQELRAYNQIRHKTSKTVCFSRPYSQLPCIPVGLTGVDIDNRTNPRVMSFANNIHNDRMEINIDSWGDTNLHGAGCAWLEIESNDPDFQAGSYNTIEDHSWQYPQVHNTRKVIFPRAYDSTPVVVVWLATLDMNYNKNWRVRTFATDVTARGFTIHIDTWLDSILYIAKATWVAYPSGKPEVYSGRFSTLDLRPSKDPQLYNSGYEKFGSDVFDAPPRALLAIDSLDIEHGRNMRLKVKASTVSATGMTWHLDAWGDTILYSAGASYIALS